jgi:LytS/YehU family sensor histidine kinase
MGYITGIAITLKLLRQQIASREKERNLVKEKLQTELKFLKNQTNPHFLFNTLNNIYALARKKSDKTPEMVMKLSELLSFVLYESGRERISLQEDIRILEDYIDLQKIRYNGRLSLSFQKNIANADGLIAPLVLLPLIENAFKYGASENRFNSYINVSIHEKAGWLKYEVENSVEKKEEKKEKECIGLNNTRRQLELMYKEYEMAIDHNEDFFKVMLTINLNSYGKI